MQRVRVEDLDQRLVVLIGQANQLGAIKGNHKKGAHSIHTSIQSHTQKYSEQLEALRMEAILLRKQADFEDDMDSFDRSYEFSLVDADLKQELQIKSVKPTKPTKPTHQSSVTPIVAVQTQDQNQSTNTTSTDALDHTYYQVFQKPKTATLALDDYIHRPSRIPTKMAAVPLDSEDEDLIDISIESHSSSFNELSEEEINRIKEKGFDELQASVSEEIEIREKIDYPWAEDIIDELSSLLPPPYKGYEDIAPVYGLGGRFNTVNQKKPWTFLDEVDWRYFDLSQISSTMDDYSVSNPPADLQEKTVYTRPVPLKIVPTPHQVKITDQLSLDDLNQAYQALEQQIPSVFPQSEEEPANDSFEIEFPIVQEDQQFEAFIGEFQFDPNAFDAQLEEISIDDEPEIVVQNSIENMPFSMINTEIILTGESTAVSQPFDQIEEEDMPLRSFEDSMADMPTLMPNDEQGSTVDQITTDEFQSIRSQLSMTTDEFVALQPQNTLNTLPDKKKKGFLARLFGGKKD